MPLVVTVPFIIGFWLVEAGVHVHLFGADFAQQVFHPAVHELWMRSLMSATMLLIGLSWSAFARERARRLEQVESHRERLRELTARLAYGDSEERREIATRLQEDVGQQLAAARLYLASLGAPHDEEGRAAVAELTRILDDSIATCRDLASDIAPPLLDEYGLGPALEALAGRVMRRTGISVEVTGSLGGASLPRQVMLVTFQVVSELIETAVADTETRAVSLRLNAGDHGLSLRLDWDARTAADFFSAHERIATVGGTFCTEPEHVGSRVTMRVPALAS